MYQQSNSHVVKMQTQPIKKLYLNEQTLNDMCMCFLNAVKNKIMPGTFTRIIYSNELFTINSIYFQFNMNVMNMGMFYNKILYKFNPDQHGLAIMKQLEKNILSQYASSLKEFKRPLLKIQEILNSGNLKIFKKNTLNFITNPTQVVHTVKNTTFCLKIIGIWESDTEYGIIYKFSLF